MTTDTRHRPEPIEHPRRTVHFYDHTAENERGRGPHLAHVERIHANGSADLTVLPLFKDSYIALAVPELAIGLMRFWRWPPAA